MAALPLTLPGAGVGIGVGARPGTPGGVGARGFGSGVRLGMDDRAGTSQLTQVVAVAGMILLGLNYSIIEGVTTATIGCIALLPVWWATTRRFVGARLLMGLVVVAVANGLWLTLGASATHEVNSLVLRTNALLILGGFAAVGTILWARTVLPLHGVVLAYGVGLLVNIAEDPPNPLNTWKYGFVYGAAVLALGPVARNRPRWIEVVLLVVLGVISALNDSRSAFAMISLAAMLLLWQLRPGRRTRQTSNVATLALLFAASITVYTVGTAAIVNGYLGEATQQRSIQQLEATGSILFGGRPEWGATRALVEHRPWGYGIGVEPSMNDILVAKSGMAQLNYDPNNGYVEKYMFGGEIKLHAIVADLWSSMGVAGALLAVVLAGLTVWSLATVVARRTGGGLVIYLGCLTLWNLLFAPIYTSMPSLALTVGLLLVDRRSDLPGTTDHTEHADHTEPTGQVEPTGATA